MINNNQEQIRPDFNELLDDFYHPNPNIHQDSSLKMADYWPAESMKILISNLDHVDIEIRRRSVKALGHFGLSLIHI